MEWEFSGPTEVSCLNVDIEFESISEEQVVKLEKIVDAWVSVGIYGGYKGLMHNASGLTKIGDSYNMLVDLGSTDPELAMETLRGMLMTFSKYDGVVIKRLMLGKMDL